MPQKAWTLDEVIERWQKLFKGSVLVDRYRSGQNLSRTEWNALSQRSVARRANQEDRCFGRFREGRQNPRPCWTRKHWQPVCLCGFEPGTRKNGSNTGIIGVHVNRRTHRCSNKASEKGIKPKRMQTNPRICCGL
jgi:hypothetical protein